MSHKRKLRQKRRIAAQLKANDIRQLVTRDTNLDSIAEAVKYAVRQYALGYAVVDISHRLLGGYHHIEATAGAVKRSCYETSLQPELVKICPTKLTRNTN